MNGGVSIILKSILLLQISVGICHREVLAQNAYPMPIPITMPMPMSMSMPVPHSMSLPMSMPPSMSMPIPYSMSMPISFPMPMPIVQSSAYPNPNGYNEAINQYIRRMENHYANLSKYENEIWTNWKNNIGAKLQPYTPPNYAASTSSYGPNGFHQSAGIYPPNTNLPNVDVNLPNGPNGVNGPNGPRNGNSFYGITTSSFSESMNVNGVESSRRGAVTTVNDNGKISTYNVES